MPITDPLLPHHFLEALDSVSVKFLVLHRESEIGTEALDGDLDIAVETTPSNVLELAIKDMHQADLHPVISWPYDVGGTVAFFLSTEDGQQGMQADLLYDPRGIGRYGVRSNVLLDHAIQGKRYLVPQPLDQSLYLISKRWHKGQASAMNEELRILHGLANSSKAHQRAEQLFASGQAQSIQKLISGGHPRQNLTQFRVRQLSRKLGRAIRPVGFWVELVGPAPEGRLLADGLNQRFQRWVPHIGRAERPKKAGYLWWLRNIAPVTVRPGIFISHAGVPSRPDPNLAIEWHRGITLDECARSIVSAMSTRVTS